MYKVTCPNCDHEFIAEFDSEGIVECPNCHISLALGDGFMTGYDMVSEFEECYAECAVLYEEVQNLDDASLEDEISHELVIYDFMEGTFNIATEMDAVGYMAWDTRRKAEGVYLLVHTQKVFGHEH